MCVRYGGSLSASAVGILFFKVSKGVCLRRYIFSHDRE